MPSRSWWEMPSVNVCSKRAQLAGRSRWTKRATASKFADSDKGEIQMTLANIFFGLHRAELARPKLRADFANSFSLRRAFGKLNEQAIGELVAGFAAVNVGRDHLA